MFQNPKNKILYGSFVLWALFFFIFLSFKIAKLTTLPGEAVKLENAITVFGTLETVVLWVLLAAITWTLITKLEHLKKPLSLILIGINCLFVIISLLYLIVPSYVLSIVVSLTLILVVLSVTTHLLQDKKIQDELIKNILVIGLKSLWAIVSLLVAVFPNSLPLQIVTLIVTLTMVTTSVYFISLKNVNLELQNQDILSPMTS